MLGFLGQLIQPFLVPVCFVTAWGVVGLTLWTLYASAREGVQTAQQMHEIPCAKCQYFTGDYTLKCTVHPSSALSEDAIGCIDFWP
jgi:hypothetical protein